LSSRSLYAGSTQASAVARSNLVFVSVYQRIQGGPIYQAFFYQQRFQCLGSQRRIGRNDLVVVMMVVIMRGHKFLAPSHLRLVLAFKT